VAQESAAPSAALRAAVYAAALIAPINPWLGVSVGQFSVHPLHLWALVVIPFVLASAPGELARSLDFTTLMFASLLVSLTGSTLVGTPPAYQVRGFADLVLLAINVATFATIHGVLARRPEIAARFIGWLTVGAIISGILLGARAIVESRKVLLNADSNAFGLGTVIGTYASAFAAGCTVAVIFAPTRRFATVSTAALLVSGPVALLSLARGPWIAGLLAVAICVPLCAWQLRHTLEPRKMLLRLAGPFALMVLVAIALIATNLTRLLVVVNRILALNEALTPVSSGGTAFVRIQLWAAMLDEVRRSPLFGYGAASFRQISMYLGTAGQIAENFCIEMLHAGGLLALTCLLAGVAGCIAAGVRNDEEPDQTFVVMRLTMLAAGIGVFFGTLTNPSAWNGAFWVVLAATASPPRSRYARRMSGRSMPMYVSDASPSDSTPAQAPQASAG
jgi:hypothetical protein